MFISAVVARPAAVHAQSHVMSLSCACTDTHASFLAVTIASDWLLLSHYDTAWTTNLLVIPCGMNSE